MSMSYDAVDVLVASNFSASSVLPALGSPEAQFQQLMMNVMWDYGYAVGCMTLHQPCAGAVHLLGKADGGSAVVKIGTYRLQILSSVCHLPCGWPVQLPGCSSCHTPLGRSMCHCLQGSSCLIAPLGALPIDLQAAPLALKPSWHL